MDVSRARHELGWAPRLTAGDALLDLLHGLREGAGEETPPLDPHAGGPARMGEFASGVGAR
jgi:UDP-glucose 4-epimerase